MSKLSTFLKECKLAGYVVEEPTDPFYELSNGGHVLAWVLKESNSGDWVGIGVIDKLYLVWEEPLSYQKHNVYGSVDETIDAVEAKIRSWE